MKIQLLIALSVVTVSCASKPAPGPDSHDLRDEPQPRRFSTLPKTGFTIWGVQPGDKIEDLLKNLPKDMSAETAAGLVGATGPDGPTHPNVILHAPEGQDLEISTSLVDGVEVVQELRVWPVSGSLSIEWSGESVLRGRATTADVLKAFGSEAKAGGGEFKITRSPSELSLVYFSDHGIDGAVLKASANN